ncbi:unnamed protein product [Adineta steineri]|uniref:Golgi apparatus protein 1 n=2 Tax=Adineta steineri TaxID=433720 RepID=A0A814N4Q0_9BILA|nr:unnamed protein product [Adineta steineri]CAF3826630.1 unnamed protein product [Adineta steineri]
MLLRRLVVLYLFILFTGSLAQRNVPNVDKENDDEDGDDNDLDTRKQSSINRDKTRKRISTGNDDNNVRSLPRSDNQQQSVNSVRKSQQNLNPLPVAGQSSRSAPIPIANSEECRADVLRYCSKGSKQMITNLKVLQCVDELDNAVNLISKDCQHHIYSFKYNMTHDPRFDDAAQRQCSKDIKLLDECEEFVGKRGSGRLVSCLYDRLGNITEPSCRYFINQMQAVVFNDWTLSEYMVDACMSDINKLECGRLDDDNKAIPHEQGAVIACLSQKYAQLLGPCKKEIFRLAEMQSDDYHLDRALFYACRDDRERLCSQVQSGNGRVYRCLYDQKFNTMMSPACRKEVQRRQSLVVANVQVDAPLIRACKGEMIQHQCSVDPNENDKRSSLVKLLLCLEDKFKKGEHIQDDCRREMLVHRRMLMSDYSLSPEIVSECKTEMIRYCPSLLQQGAGASVDQRGGRMIHCLLNSARKQKDFGSSCLNVVKSLVRAVDPGSDIRADPLLETACRPVIDTLCPRIKPGDSNIIMCLLDNLKSNRMTEECEDRLMEVTYFMARDWRLTPKLLRTCRTNLVNLCQLPTNWSMTNELKDDQIGMYLGCLYQQRQQLDRDCRTELKRLMHIRTQAIGLMPEIEDNCIEDLATCKNPEVKGEEMKCLQKKYAKLEEKCKAAVRNFTQMTMSDPTLDFLLMKACEPMIQLFCANIEGGNENDLIRCLIKHKSEQKMDYRCKAGIDHHQITSMKDEAFLSQQFRKKCRQEVEEHCKGKKTKASVIQCLADLMLKDVLKGQNQITEVCRDELKFELLQRSESIEFDPLLAKACQGDIKKFCSDRTPGNAEILDCLKDNHAKVSPVCYAKLKKRQKLDVILPENDFSLVSKCAPVIQKFCSNEKKQNMLSCLRRNANQDQMPNICRRVLYHRLMILNTDARFNRGLVENCKQDIEKWCSSDVVDNDDDDDDKDSDDADDNNDAKGGDNNDSEVTDRDMGGRIIGCLRSKYADSTATLESQCVTELIDVIQTSKLDVTMDIKLYQSCRKQLDSKCTGMDKEDCLKLLYQKGQLNDDACREQVKRIIREGRADIHVDRALAFACQTDILKYCNDIPIGSGKQLQCLLNMGKSVTTQCQNMLKQRQELWGEISNVDGVVSLTKEISKSSNNIYLISVILLILCVMFMAGCVCRPYLRYNRVRKYK